MYFLKNLLSYFSFDINSKPTFKQSINDDYIYINKFIKQIDPIKKQVKFLRYEPEPVIDKKTISVDPVDFKEQNRKDRTLKYKKYKKN